MATFQDIPTELRVMIYSLPSVLQTQGDGSPPSLLTALSINSRLLAKALATYQSINLRILSNNSNSHTFLTYRQMTSTSSNKSRSCAPFAHFGAILLEVAPSAHYDRVQNGILKGFIEIAGRKIYDEELDGVEICINRAAKGGKVGSSINVLHGLVFRKEAKLVGGMGGKVEKVSKDEIEAELAAMSIKKFSIGV
ncbi:uncharacterized protein PAC_08688 [Phialocephala subalpina]|uniref:Uncharacterized protein n=1 Tax=Phialocephala subalpina TaxID=576137 RepID=A0A1L7X1A7_9HELO|nr:uncharacterized protein PAC_08688 [Phialocephala subalpina]